MADTFTFSIPAGTDHNILREALKALADYIGNRIPALVDTHVGHADPEESAVNPCATLLPGKFTFDGHLGVDELPLQTNGQALLDVGCWDGTVELRVSGRTKAERERLEGQLQALFMSAKRRGVLVLQTPILTVNGIVTLWAAPVAFSILSSSWEEEMVWDKVRYSFMTLTMSYPALVCELDTYTINEYHSALTEDLTSVSPVFEALKTDEFGNLTPQ